MQIYVPAITVNNRISCQHFLQAASVTTAKAQPWEPGNPFAIQKSEITRSGAVHTHLTSIFITALFPLLVTGEIAKTENTVEIQPSCSSVSFVVSILIYRITVYIYGFFAEKLYNIQEK